MTKFLTLLVSTVLMMLMISVAMAVDPAAVVVPGESMIQSLIDFLSSPTGVIVAGGTLEVLLRFVKSDKSLGILQLVGHGLQVFGKGAVAVGEFLDKILGQRKK